MLLLPALPLDVAAWVFADDADPGLFYAVPELPRVQRRTDGSAALSFLKYRIPPAGTAEADGGGFLDFRTELVLDGALRAAVLDQLAARGVAAPRLGEPTWLDGTVGLVTLGATPGGLVEQIGGSTRPSLTGANAAWFAMRLSRDGAALLWTQLREAEPPIAVQYSLTVMARFPPARVRVWCRAGPLRAAWDDLAGLTPDARRSALAARGVAGAEVLDWPPAGETAMDALREEVLGWGWDQVDRGLGGALNAPVGAPPPDWAQVVDVETVFTGRSGVGWPLRPRGSVGALVGAEFHEADLGDPVFERIDVESRCDADFDGDRIDSVELRLRHGGQQHEAVFTDTAAVDSWHAVVDPGSARSYTYAAVVQFRASSRTLALPEATAEARNLLLQVGPVGWVRIDVDGSGVDWDRTALVEVHLTYADPERGVDAQDDLVVLRASEPVAHYERAVWVPVDRPWSHRATHVLHDGTRVDGPGGTRTGRSLVVTDPYARFLTVGFRAPGGFAAVALHRVECAHERPSGAVEQDVLALAPEAERATWSVGLLPGEEDRYRRRVTTTFRDGHVERGEWVEGAGSGAVDVGDLPAGLLTVTATGELLDYAVVRLAHLSLRHAVPGGDERTGSLVFRAEQRGKQTWTVPLHAGEAPDYSWSALFHLADGTRRTAAATGATDRILVLLLPSA